MILPLLSSATNIGTIDKNKQTETATDFTVTQQKQIVQLRWIGSNEAHVSHFYVEKSFDGISYKQVAIVFSDKSTSKEITYQFPDKNINNKHKKIFYRLRTIDIHGNSTLSQEKNISLN